MIMEKDFQSLVGKLINVIIGDIIILKAPNRDGISEFVAKIREYIVELSHEDPNNKMTFYHDAGSNILNLRLSKGNRWYYLGDFDTEKIKFAQTPYFSSRASKFNFRGAQEPEHAPDFSPRVLDNYEVINSRKQ